MSGWWPRPRVAAGIVVAGLVSLAGAGWLYAASWRPSPADYPQQGVDVSAAHGDVPWAGLRADGASFGYARATDGLLRDVRFDSNWDAIAAAGLRRGASHRFSLCAGGAEQARRYVTVVPRDDNALPGLLELDLDPDDPACPVRPARDALLGEIGAFLIAAERHMGKPMLVALSPAFEAEYRASSAIRRPLWASGDFREPDYLSRPWRVWRATTMRRVAEAPEPLNWSVVAP